MIKIHFVCAELGGRWGGGKVSAEPVMSAAVPREGESIVLPAAYNGKSCTATFTVQFIAWVIDPGAGEERRLCAMAHVLLSGLAR